MRKLKAKMGFFDLAKHGLNKHGFKDQNWYHVLGEERNHREREEKKKRRRRRREAKQAKVWKLTLIMELNGSMEL